MVLQKAEQFEINPGIKEAFSFSDIHAEAQALLDEAREQASAIVGLAREQALKIHRVSQEKGFDEGRLAGEIEGKKKGYDQALQENQKLFSTQSKDLQALLRDILNILEQSKQTILWQAEQDTVRLSLAIAEKVTKQSALQSRQVAIDNVKASLALVTKSTDILIRVNALDIEHLNQLAGGPDEVFGKYERIRFEVDDSIEPGGCILESQSGRVDGQLQKQIDRIVNELLSDAGMEGIEA